MIRMKRGALAIAAALCWAAAAQAGPITVVQTTAGDAGIEQAHFETQLAGKDGYSPISANGSTSRDGFRNGNVLLDVGRYTLEYWGSGSSTQNNTFRLLAPGMGEYTFSGSAIYSFGPGGTGAGGFGGGYIVDVAFDNTLLEFEYSTSGSCAPTRNGAAVSSTVCNYLAGVDGVVLPAGTSIDGTVGYLGYADLPEVGDIDHQDLTVRISSVPVPVPEPASLALVGAALAGLGFARKRKAS